MVSILFSQVKYSTTGQIPKKTYWFGGNIIARFIDIQIDLIANTLLLKVK